MSLIYKNMKNIIIQLRMAYYLQNSKIHVNFKSNLVGALITLPDLDLGITVVSVTVFLKEYVKFLYYF